MEEIGKNYVANENRKTVDEALNAGSITLQRVTGTEYFDSLKEYEIFSGNKLSAQKNKMILPITLGNIGGVGLLVGGLFFWKKTKSK